MLVGIYDMKDCNGKDLEVQKTYDRILASNGIDSIRLRVEQPDFWHTIGNLSLFIMRFSHYDSDLAIAQDLLPIIEREHGVKCYPNLSTAWHFDDKIKQYHLLRSMGFPMIESWVFYDRVEALKWTEHASYPVIFKLRGGAGSMNVIFVKNRRQARTLVKRMFGKGIRSEGLVSLDAVRLKYFSLYREFHHLGGNLYRWSKGLDTTPYWRVQKNYALFQKFLAGNKWDTRVTVIGGRAFAFRRLVRDNDFRASGSGRIDYDMKQIDLRCVQIALDVSKKRRFQSMGYDFLTNEEGEPEFCEISYTYLSSAVQACPGYWDDNLNWHDGHFCPEHLQLIDALGLPELKEC